jgi:hypothetical protein
MSESQDHGSDGENSEETYKEPRVFRFLDLPAGIVPKGHADNID